MQIFSNAISGTTCAAHTDTELCMLPVAQQPMLLFSPL